MKPGKHVQTGRRWGLRDRSVVLAGMLLLVAGQAWGDTLPTLTRAQDVRALGMNRAPAGYPVHLQAVVTYYDPGADNDRDLFVKDGTAGIWVDAPPSNLGLKSGDLVDIKGVSAAPDFAPQVKLRSVSVLGRQALPDAPLEPFSRLASGADDSQWVAVEGIVRSAAVANGRLELDIATDGGRLTVRLLSYASLAPDRLIDSRVRVYGACGALFNQRNQIIGVMLYVAAADQIRVLEPGTQSPFAMPVQPISTVLQFRPGGISGHRVRVQGVVSYQNPGQTLYIRDASEGLYVETAQTTKAEVGDLVSVSGFPEPGEYSPVLRDAVFVRVGRAPEPVPHEVSAEQAASGAYDGDVISLEGKLLDQDHRTSEGTLFVRSGDVSFRAQIERKTPGQPWPSLVEGSRLRLTGVSVVRVNHAHVPVGFRLLLREPDDIAVVALPPWWTLKRVGWLLALMAAALLASIAWAAVLNHRVRQKTALLMQRLQEEIVLEQRYRDLFENSTHMVFTLDPQGHITSWNRAAEQISGLESAEAVKMNLEALIAPDQRAEWRRILTQEIPARKATSYRLDFIARSGRRVPLEASSRVITLKGAMVAVQTDAQDVTERYRADALAAAEKAVLEMIADEVPSPLVLDSIAGMVERHVPGLAVSITAFDASRPAPTPHPITAAAEPACFPIFSPEGTELGRLDVKGGPACIASAEDRRMVEEMALPLARLAILRSMRREELARQAKELARSNAELGQFAYVASHDLQEPLRMVTGFTRLIEEACQDKLDAETRQYMAYVLEGAERMRCLIRDLLAFARVGSGSRQLKPVSSAQALERAQANLRTTIDESGAEVACGPLPMVLGESAQLAQLFQNLVGNALKYRGAAPPRVRVAAERDGDYWVFSVEDNGIGMEPKYADRIFLMFQRLHGAGQYSGTGIGLAIAKKIVEYHEGKIWVESQPGQGSTFYFRIPAAAGETERCGTGVETPMEMEARV